MQRSMLNNSDSLVVGGRYREFWVVSNQFLARLYRTPLLTLAAIRGACPAGGCCMSLCCDLRFMVDGPGHIGLNEVRVPENPGSGFGQALMARCHTGLNDVRAPWPSLLGLR